MYTDSSFFIVLLWLTVIPSALLLAATFVKNDAKRAGHDVMAKRAGNIQFIFLIALVVVLSIGWGVFGALVSPFTHVDAYTEFKIVKTPHNAVVFLPDGETFIVKDDIYFYSTIDSAKTLYVWRSENLYGGRLPSFGVTPSTQNLTNQK